MMNNEQNMAANLEQDQAKAIGKKLETYAQAVLVMDLYTTAVSSTVSLGNAQKIIDKENQRPNPRLVDVIAELINSQTEPLKEGEDCVVTIGGVASYVINVKYNEDGSEDVIVKKMLCQEAEGQPLELKEVELPNFTITQQGIDDKGNRNQVKFEVKLGNDIVLTDKSPRPKELQRQVIQEYARQLLSGHPRQLAVMGTGTGKSWVIAGVTHATGNGIIIVPNQDLAKETRDDAIKILHGNAALAGVRLSTDYDSVEAFEAALKDPDVKQIIMVVEGDPLFHEKTDAIQNRVVLMDETHQHTFTPDGIKTLQKIKDNNLLLAVTGTPTSKLMTIFDKPMVEKNVRSVMDKGDLRQNYRRTDTGVLSTDLIHKAQLGYFARDEFLIRGPGVITTEQLRKSVMEATRPPNDTPEAKARIEKQLIDQAIENNRERGLTQKSFFFSGDDSVRKQAMSSYTAIANNQLDPAATDQLMLEIRNQRYSAELNARIAMLTELHKDDDPKLTEAEITDIAEIQVKIPRVLKPAMLAKEIADAQKKQIAQSVNSDALHLLFPKMKKTAFEKMFRIGTIGDFLEKNKNALLALEPAHLEEELKSIAPGLPAAQRESYLAKVRQAYEGLLAKPAKLMTIDDINLQEMGAKYTASVTDKDPNKTTDAESSAILDQLRIGLAMHVASDTKYTTGISIPSVLSVQQVEAHRKSCTSDPVNASQLHGRNIRDNDRGAFNQQVLAIGVDDAVPLETIYDRAATAKMDEIYAAERAAEVKLARLKEVIGMLEARMKVAPEATEKATALIDEANVLIERINSISDEEICEEGAEVTEAFDGPVASLVRTASQLAFNEDEAELDEESDRDKQELPPAQQDACKTQQFKKVVKVLTENNDKETPPAPKPGSSRS